MGQTKRQNTEGTIDHSDQIQLELVGANPQLDPVAQSQSSDITQNLKASVSHSAQYRPQIDGLRAVAILLVIIYHAYPKALPGGYIGVDVFFVISGFLISQIIIKQTHNNTFTYKDFYLRRIKRIIPTLLVILAATLFILWNYSQLSQTILTLNTLDASLLFSANLQVLFYERGYFDAEMRSNFLLHLWSLGVQEQFYIFWPCILMTVLKKYPNKVFNTLAIYALCSFVISIIGINLNHMFAYYFPFCRFWQMSVGGILAYLNANFKGSKINNVISTFSLGAILLTVFLIDEKSLFPGFWALIPTFGAAFIIQAKNKAFINLHILSSKPVVFIGKISYSLYLWHWPLLVFSHTFYPKGSDSIFASTPFILALCFILSCSTYYFIENPIRMSKKNKQVFGSLLFSMLIIVAISFGIGIYIWLGHWAMDKSQAEVYFKKVDQEMRPRPDEDFVTINRTQHPNLSKSSNRLKSTVQKIKAARLDMQFDAVNGIECFLEKRIDKNSIFYEPDQPEMTEYNVLNEGQEKKLLVLGDSHAMRLSYRFQQLHRESIEKNATNQLATVVGMYHSQYPLNNERSEFINFGLKLVEKHKIKKVFLISHWLIYWCTNLQNPVPQCFLDDAKRHIAEMMEFVKKFQKLGAEVSVLTIDFDLQKLHPKNMIDFTGVIEKNLQSFSRSEFREKFKMIIEPYEKAIGETNATVIDLADNLCWEDKCYVTTPTGYATYTDGGHIGKFYGRHWLSVVDHLAKF